MGHALTVEVCDGGVDGTVERIGVGEGLMGAVMGFEIVPDQLDIVEFGRILGQPFDGEPVGAGGQVGERALAGVDRAIVLDRHDRLGAAPWLGPGPTVEAFKMGDAVAAAPGGAGIVQFGRSATGCSSKGVTTRKAASRFIAGGPGATLACNASTTKL